MGGARALDALKASRRRCTEEGCYTSENIGKLQAQGRGSKDSLRAMWPPEQFFKGRMVKVDDSGCKEQKQEGPRDKCLLLP